MVQHFFYYTRIIKNKVGEHKHNRSWLNLISQKEINGGSIVVQFTQQIFSVTLDLKKSYLMGKGVQALVDSSP